VVITCACGNRIPQRKGKRLFHKICFKLRISAEIFVIFLGTLENLAVKVRNQALPLHPFALWRDGRLRLGEKLV
jgi:hypothetical protein